MSLSSWELGEARVRFRPKKTGPERPRGDLSSGAAQAILLVAGGRAPEVGWLRRFARDKRPWGVDRGIDVLRRAGVRPEGVLGDGDSGSASGWEWAHHKGAWSRKAPVEKDDTDLQLALSRASEEGCPIWITGAFGGRLDHLFSGIGTAAAHPAVLGMADDREWLLFLRAPGTLTVRFRRRPLALSLLPITEECAGVTLRGVRWELEEALLRRDYPYAISNRVLREGRIRTGCLRGVLGVYAAA